MNKKPEDISIDALKAAYLSEQEIQLARMKDQLSLLGNKSKKIGTAALIVGGVLLVGYIVGRKLFTKKENKLSGIPSTHLMVQNSKNELPIVTLIKEQIMFFLMAIIKEKLTAYMNAVENKK
jgi:hypothetical protein